MENYVVGNRDINDKITLNWTSMEPFPVNGYLFNYLLILGTTYQDSQVFLS
jgi:hypothetical protein